MPSGEISILCTAPEHVSAADAFGMLTVVRSSEPAWAFCPSLATDGHQWVRTATPCSLPAARLAARRQAGDASSAI